MLRRSPSVITISETDVAEIKRLAEARSAANANRDNDQARAAAHALLGVGVSSSINSATSTSGTTRPASGSTSNAPSFYASVAHPGNESGVSTVNGNTTATQMPTLLPPSLTNQDEN